MELCFFGDGPAWYFDGELWHAAPHSPFVRKQESAFMKLRVIECPWEPEISAYRFAVEEDIGGSWITRYTHADRERAEAYANEYAKGPRILLEITRAQ